MRQFSQKAIGYTTVELAVTIAMIAILASAAYAMYNQYITEAKATEGVSLLLAVGQDVNNIKNTTSCLSSRNIVTQSGMTGEITINGQYKAKLGATCPTGCTATFTFNGDAPVELRNKTVSADILNSGQMSLAASNTTLDPTYYQDVLTTVPRSLNETCAEIKPNPAQSIEGTALSDSSVPKGTNLQPQNGSLILNLNTEALKITGDESPSFYAKALYKMTQLDLRQRYATPSNNVTVGAKTTLQGLSQQNVALTYANPLQKPESDDTASLMPISNLPYSGVFSDGTSLQYNMIQTFYIDKNNHLISRFFIDQQNDKAYDAYPSVTIELMDEVINGSTGEKTLIPRNFSFTLQRIKRSAKVNGMVFGYSGLVDLGAIPDPRPPYLYTGWQNSLLNKSNNNYAEGVLKITFNKK